MKNTKKRGFYSLKIAKKEVNLLFNMRFWALLDDKGYKLEELDKHLAEGNGVMSMINVLSNIVLSGVEANCIKNNIDQEYSIDDVYEWFEEDIDQEELEKILKAMMETKIFGNTINPGEEPKKLKGR
ncbi:MAG: hypothetical protein K0U41_04075 [Gammaproteobacteria bacterium]|nr:hypothetical protein [Gammaproteobacteria bacterium]